MYFRTVMHYRAVCLLMTAVAILSAGAASTAQASDVSAVIHPWGRFDPGAWKTVRVVTETFNEQGQIVSTSITDTKTTLLDIDNDGVTLEIQSCMEVAGKRFEADPQTVKQGFHGELLGSTIKIGEPADGEVTIEERKIACKTLKIEAQSANSRTITTIYFSTSIAPYMLRRESISTDLEGNNTLSETSVTTLALQMPIKLNGETRSGAFVKTVHRGTNGTVTTLASFLEEVPGGVVGNSSKETDKSGRLVRRSTLDLLDFGIDPDEDRSGIFNRKRPPRHRAKQPPR